MSSSLAVVGFLLLVLSFEQMIRASVVQGAENYSQLRMIDGKFAIAHELARACADGAIEKRRLCQDLYGLNAQFNFDLLSMDGELPRLGKTDNASLSTIVQTLNTYIESINMVRRGLSAPPMFDVGVRIWIALISAVLVALSIAGSLGEAIFQYRQARRLEEERKKGAEVKAA